MYFTIYTLPVVDCIQNNSGTRKQVSKNPSSSDNQRYSCLSLGKNWYCWGVKVVFTLEMPRRARPDPL